MADKQVITEEKKREIRDKIDRLSSIFETSTAPSNALLEKYNQAEQKIKDLNGEIAELQKNQEKFPPAENFNSDHPA